MASHYGHVTISGACLMNMELFGSDVKATDITIFAYSVFLIVGLKFVSRFPDLLHKILFFFLG